MLTLSEDRRNSKLTCPAETVAIRAHAELGGPVKLADTRCVDLIRASAKTVFDGPPAVVPTITIRFVSM